MSELKKTCTKCGVEKEISEFHKKNNGKYGRESRCKLCKKEYDRVQKLNNPEKYKQIHKRYRENNKKKILTRQRKRNIEKKEDVNKYQRDYRNKRRKEDPLFKLSDNIRTLIGNSLRSRSFRKTSKVCDILGCTLEQLYNHLKGTFEDNYNIPIEEAEFELHIDHITPLSTAETEDDIIRLNHYTNLQYLYKKDNLKKSNKINWK